MRGGAGASVLAGLAQTLVDVAVTHAARVAGKTVAGVCGKTVLTGAIVARPREALVDVRLAVPPAVTWRINHMLGFCIFSNQDHVCLKLHYVTSLLKLFLLKKHLS